MTNSVIHVSLDTLRRASDYSTSDVFLLHRQLAAESHIRGVINLCAARDVFLGLCRESCAGGELCQ